jgi:cobalt/nickel transport system permease protein
MEGFLPGPWWQLWFVFSIPVLFFGMYRMNKLINEKRELLPLLAVAGAFIFVLSSLKMPSVTGSSSHPTGTGMAAILFGPAITSVLSVIVLIYQALFLAHGGFTTLGANVASMGIIGPVIAYIIYKAGMKANINFYVVVFLATAFADWATYVVTSVQLATGLFWGGDMITPLKGFLAVFATTQVPIAIMEGALTALVFKYILQVKSDALVELKVITRETAEKLKGAVA